MYFVFAIKTRGCTIMKGKVKEVNFSIVGDRIPTVKENSVKSVGKWYENELSDRYKGIEILKQAEDRLKTIDKILLSENFKVWCLQYGLCPRFQWPLK